MPNYVSAYALNRAMSIAWDKVFHGDVPRETFTAEEVEQVFYDIRDTLLRQRVTSQQAVLDEEIARTVIVDEDRKIIGDYSEQLELSVVAKRIMYSVIRLSARHISKLPENYTHIPEFGGHENGHVFN